MPYSRLLNLDTKTKADLIIWLNTRIVNHRAERSAYDQQLVDWNQDYWAEPVVKEKTFPFKGACSIIIPLTAIAVEAVHANIMGTLFGLPDFINVLSRSPQFEDSIRDWENFANFYLTDKIKIKKKIEPAIQELEKFGTGIAKVKYEKIVKYGMREVAGVETQFPVTIKDGPDLVTIPCSKFMMPFNATDPQEAEWVGELHNDSLHQIKVMQDSGLFYDDVSSDLDGETKSVYEKIQAYSLIGETTDKVQVEQQNNEDRKPIIPAKNIDWYEFWTDYNIDDPDEKDPNTIKYAVQIFYHYASQTLMAVRYNSFSDIRRPYRTGVYIPVEHRWAGIGICKQNDQFQLEVTIQHRQRIDNATIANIRMFKVAKMSGYGPKEPIFPGKMWFLDDMKDIEAFQIGEIYPSAYNNEQQTLLYSQQRTGVNELTMGMPQVGTPGTATSDLSRVQESKRKSDYVLENIKDFITPLIGDIFDCLQTYGPQSMDYLESNDPDGKVAAILAQPSNMIRDSIIFKMNISGQSSNQILDQQNQAQIAQFTTQYWTQMMALAQQSGNPQLIQMFTMKAMSSATEIMDQLLANLNVKNVDRVIINQKMLDSIFNPQPAQLDPNQIAGAQGGNQQLLSSGGNQRIAGALPIGGVVPNQASIR